MEPTDEQYNSPHKRKLDDRVRTKIWLTVEMTFTKLYNEVYSKLGDLFNFGAMEDKFLFEQTKSSKREALNGT